MNTEYLITLLETPRIGRKTARYLADNLSFKPTDLKDLLGHIEDLKVKNKRLPTPKYSDLEFAFEKAQNILDKSEKSNIKVVSRYSGSFPKSLLDIPDSPVVLYAKGNFDLLSEIEAVAVIGTREPSNIGIKLGQRITELFVENRLVIVSGLAVGCDSIAHETCLKKDGQTIAVLPSGLDYIYPKENKPLAQRMLEKQGLLISEYKIGEKPRNNFFVERDRLQSGLSNGICVIETDIKGGTMHTVGFAEKQNRLIGCINHPENERNHPKVRGNQMLIEEKRAYSLGSGDEIKNFIELIKKSHKTKELDDKPITDKKPNSDNGQLTIF